MAMSGLISGADGIIGSFYNLMPEMFFLQGLHTYQAQLYFLCLMLSKEATLMKNLVSTTHLYQILEEG